MEKNIMFWLFAALFIGLNINLLYKTEPGQEFGYPCIHLDGIMID